MPNQILQIFEDIRPEVTWHANDEHVYESILGEKSEEVPWDRLLDHYGPGSNGVYIGYYDTGDRWENNAPLWREVSVGSKDPIFDNDGPIPKVHVNVYKLDSYTMQAQRKGTIPATRNHICENAVQGFLVKDGYVLLAVRTSLPADRFNVLPGGSVSWKEEYDINPFQDAMNAETLEEAGTKLDSARLKGVFNQLNDSDRHQLTNRQWTYVGVPSRELGDIMSDHEKGFALYEEVQAVTKDEVLARNALKESPYADDAWEARKFAKLPYKADAMLELFEEEAYKYSDDEAPAVLIGSLWGAIYCAGAVDFGEDFAEEAKRIAGKHITL